jgi:hypothetical protein
VRKIAILVSDRAKITAAARERITKGRAESRGGVSMKRERQSPRRARRSRPKTTLLYAWAVPVAVLPLVDHTWVTTYDNRVTVYPGVQQVVAAGAFYWYCWGSFNPSGGTPNNPTGFLGQQSGDLALAQCLVQANADSQTVPAARGTIFTYGVDGVCHQLANQVLYSTGVGGAAPLTVRNARGYMASVFIYGDYGLQRAAWWNQIARCGGQPIQPPGGPAMVAAQGNPVPEPPDDFEAHARQVLKSDPPNLLSDLLALRADVQRFTAQRWPGVTAPDADVLNARNRHMLDQAAKLLGPQRFKAIFGFPPDQKIDLVDPSIKQR